MSSWLKQRFRLHAVSMQSLMLLEVHMQRVLATPKPRYRENQTVPGRPRERGLQNDAVQLRTCF